MPIAGFQRFRQWALSAAQSAHGTAATPSAVFPWRGTPDVNPNWTDLTDQVDTGSIDPVLDPYRMALESTATLAGPLDYNSIPIVMAAGVKGGVTATGGPAYTWTHAATSLTATTLDEISASWGDDFGQDDYRWKDGVIEDIEITFGDDLGPAQISTQWYFGSVDAHVTKPVLTITSNLPLVFGADTTLAINSTSGTIGNTLVADALHAGRIHIQNTIDKKRFMNGSNSRFAVAGYGLAGRLIEAEFTFAKVAAIQGSVSTSEMRQWLSADPVTRYLEVLSTSRQIAAGSTPFSWSQRFAGTWRTRTDGEIGGNTTTTLMLSGKYDGGLTYPYRSVVVNNNAALP